MVSRRNFFVITLIMLLVLFLFQFSEFIKDFYNDYDTNVYASSDRSLTQTSVVRPVSESDKIAASEDGYAVFIGNAADTASPAKRTVQQWCTYSKMNMLSVGSPEEYTPDTKHMPEVVFVDSNQIDFSRSASALSGIANSGVTMIFCSLPEPSVIEASEELRNILGISSVKQNKAQLKGIKLFGGFLVGGEKWYIANNEKEEKYQDMQLEVPWYILKSGTKVYMAGVLDEGRYGEVNNELQPCIIWRYRTDKTCVFAINGDYGQDNTGLGIYTAMMYEAKDYDIYPVVNSQNIIAINYPSFSSENNEQMKKRYSRSSTETLRDIIWPNLSGLINHFNAKMTYMVTPQNNYQDESYPKQEEIEYYFKLFRENGDEAGWAAYNLQDATLRQKIVADYDTFYRTVPNYKFMSMYVNENSREKTMSLLKTALLKDVRTVVFDYEKDTQMFSYLSNQVMELRTTNDGLDYTFMKDFKNRSLQTALGYSSITLDMTDVLFPEEDSPEWGRKYEDFATNLAEYLDCYSAFDKNTVSETDSRVRHFLAADYTEKREDNSIKVHIENYKENVYFILRTHGESIADITGGSWKKIEDDAYLILAGDENLSITLKPDNTLYYYR